LNPHPKLILPGPFKGAPVSVEVLFATTICISSTIITTRLGISSTTITTAISSPGWLAYQVNRCLDVTCRERGVEDERKERGRGVEREGHPEPRESGAGEVG
jgi:hypothetical protein